MQINIYLRYWSCQFFFVFLKIAFIQNLQNQMKLDRMRKKGLKTLHAKAYSTNVLIVSGKKKKAMLYLYGNMFHFKLIYHQKSLFIKSRFYI